MSRISRLHLVAVFISTSVGAAEFPDTYNSRYGIDQGYQTPAYYDPVSGNVTVDFTEMPDGIVHGYGIILGFSGFDSEAYTPFLSSYFTTNNGYGVGETNLSEGIDPGVYSLGNIAPVGMTESEMVAFYTREDSYLRPPGNSIVGELGTQIGYEFAFIHGPSPHPPVNLDGESTVPKHDRWAEEVQLQYDPGDGSLSLNATGDRGGAFAMYIVESPLLDLEAFEGIHPDYAEAAQSHISEVGFGGISEGVYDLGNVLPIGLSAAELDEALTTADFIGLPGHSAGALDISSAGQRMSLAVVPEPGGFPCVVLALLGFLRLRRMHSSTPRRPR